jgi:uracil-DNA glycosylase
MEVKIELSWKEVLAAEFEKPYFLALAQFVKSQYQSKVVYPKGSDIFRAFELSTFQHTKVVIIGQDPYHGAGQAHGLCFSVPEGEKIPPSLKNIYKELNSDLGIPISKSGNLSHWANQGVLLLNATLTVEAGMAGSHQKKGWEEFTDSVIEALSIQKKHLVFLLWGAYAIKKGSKIDTSKHLVLSAAHPSPLAAYNGFFGCKHFSATNQYLIAHHQNPIQW